MEQIQQFLPFIFIFAIMYFFMIRPQQRRAKQEREFESNLKVGDRVITKSGMHGRVSDLTETTVVLETMAGKLMMERSSISMEMSTKLNQPKAEKK